MIGNRIDLYINPPRILFGNGAIKKLGTEIKNIKESIFNLLIITDKNMEKNGILKEVEDELKRNGLKWSNYFCDTKEPDKESVKKAIRVGRKNNFDAIIGLGGGSCMDTAKAVALLLTNEGDLEEYLRRPSKEIKNESLTTILIPTSSGTGSEVSIFSVVINEKGQKGGITSEKILPKLALIDPELTISLPPRLTAGTGMDAFSHNAEAVISKLANPISDALALEAIRLIAENLRKAYYTSEDIEARANMSLAATIGGLVISFPWVAGPAILGHLVSEGISAQYNIPHGEACGVLLPYVFEFNLPNCEDKLKLIAEAMGVNTFGMSSRESAYEAIKETFKLLEDIELPTSLKDYNLPKKDIPAIVNYIVDERQYRSNLYRFNPRRISKKNMTEFLEKAWEGKDSLEYIFK